jgi:hypothetical protein
MRLMTIFFLKGELQSRNQESKENIRPWYEPTLPYLFIFLLVAIGPLGPTIRVVYESGVVSTPDS